MSDSSKANTLISGNKNIKETYLDNVSYASQKNWIFQQVPRTNSAHEIIPVYCRVVTNCTNRFLTCWWNPMSPQISKQQIFLAASYCSPKRLLIFTIIPNCTIILTIPNWYLLVFVSWATPYFVISPACSTPPMANFSHFPLTCSLRASRRYWSKYSTISKELNGIFARVNIWN